MRALLRTGRPRRPARACHRALAARLPARFGPLLFHPFHPPTHHTLTAMHANLIAGRWTEGVRTYQNTNPSDTRDVIGDYAVASREQALDAVAAAHAAFPALSSESRLCALASKTEGIIL